MPNAFETCPDPPLQALRELIAESRLDIPDALPPMAAGIFGYMGYDTVRLIEHLSTAKPDPLGLPDSILVRPTLVVIFDAVKDEMTVVTPVRPMPGVSAKAAYSRAADRLNIVIERLEQPLPHVSDLEAEAAHHIQQFLRRHARLHDMRMHALQHEADIGRAELQRVARELLEIAGHDRVSRTP